MKTKDFVLLKYEVTMLFKASDTFTYCYEFLVFFAEFEAMMTQR